MKMKKELFIIVAQLGVVQGFVVKDKDQKLPYFLYRRHLATVFNTQKEAKVVMESH